MAVKGWYAGLGGVTKGEEKRAPGRKSGYAPVAEWDYLELMGALLQRL